MVSVKLFRPLGVGATVILSALTGFTPYPGPVLSQVPEEGLVSLEFPPAPNRQAPKGTIGGGVRGRSCISGGMPLTALMPNRDNQAKTIAANPTFFVYVPPTEAKMGKLIVTDDDGQEFLTEEIALSGRSGIIKLNIPESKQLETGKQYQWQFSLICDEELFIKGTSLHGKIERIDLSAETKAKLEQQTTPIEKAIIYASNNIWQETLTIIADQRSNYPQEWQELLTSVGLGDFAQAPFIN
jgi:hypothetical protein